jgi:hypothetical protein
LLHDVCELVRQQFRSGGRLGGEFAITEHDVGSVGIGTRAVPPCRGVRLAIAMDPHALEIVTESGFPRRANGGPARLADGGSCGRSLWHGTRAAQCLIGDAVGFAFQRIAGLTEAWP